MEKRTKNLEEMMTEVSNVPLTFFKLSEALPFIGHRKADQIVNFADKKY